MGIRFDRTRSADSVPACQSFCGEHPMSEARRAEVATAIPNDLDSYWMPFTPNRMFKAYPRLIARAKDMHYLTVDGELLIDGTAGLWCVNAGHNREPIVDAIQQQAS